MRSLWHLVVRKLEMGRNHWILHVISIMNCIARLDTLQGSLLLWIFYSWMANCFWVICLNYIFPFLRGQKFFSNLWSSMCFLRQFLIIFSSKTDPCKARVDLLFCRGWKRWINRHSTPSISMGKVQKLFITLSKLEPFLLNSLGIFLPCFHSADI